MNIMRLTATPLFFLPLLAATYAWSPLTLLQRVLEPSPSPIPQFVLDTNHAWLASNKAWLSRYPDVHDAICARSSSLWTHPNTPAHALPEDLFGNLTINNSKCGVDRLGWTNFAARLREMRGCAAALDGVRYLDINVYTHDGLSFPWLEREPTQPPGDLPALAADVLAKMAKLERLDWGLSGAATRAFETAFVEKDLTLPSVRYLRPGAGSDYLVSRCPNLEILEAGSYAHHWSWNQRVPGVGDPLLEVIKAATGTSLREARLDAGWDGWSLDKLESRLLFHALRVLGCC